MSIKTKLLLLSLLLVGLGVALTLSFQEMAWVTPEENGTHRSPNTLLPAIPTIALTLLCLFLSTVALWLLVNGLLRPLQRLAHIVRSRANTPVNLQTEIPTEGLDELGDLAHAFNQILGKLRDTTHSNALADNIFGVMQDGLIVLDQQNHIQRVNKALLDLFDEKAENMVGMALDHLLPDPTFGAILFRNLLSNRPFQAQETRLQTREGGEIPVAISGHLLKDKEAILGVILLIQDLRARKKQEEQLHFLANFDTLTKLPNRTLLHNRLHHEMARATRSNKKIGIMHCALDRFKGINDTLGHRFGDEMLQETASRLTNCLRAGDTVARVGGDEFVITLIDVVKVEDVIALATKISHAICAPFLLSNGQEGFVTTSIGLTIFPEQGSTADELLKNADIATQFAKDLGRNQYLLFSPEMTKKGNLRLAMERDLRRAIERGEMEAYYQPRWDLKKDCIVGAEALVRWRREDGRLVSPADFLPLAEELGLIEAIDVWMLKQVCQQAKKWRAIKTTPVRISVNLSHQLFQRKGLVNIVSQTLDEADLTSDALELELTEAIVMNDVAHAMNALNALRNMWIHLAVDDFGTGYSSFAYLRRLPVHILKIDRSFIREITSSQEDVAITRAIIDMAHTLKLRTTAEGVEEQAQRDLLTALGCDEMQGYLISRPLPAAEFEAKFLGIHSQ